MKRFNWKRILSLVLVLTLVVGTLTWNKRAAGAADSGNQDRSTSTAVIKNGNKTVATVTKTAKLTVDKDNPSTGTVNVTFTAKGEKDQITNTAMGAVDIVFVMDLSNSMYDADLKSENYWSGWQLKTRYYWANIIDRLTPAKDAAIAFAGKVLENNTDGKVKVGVVSFGDKAAKDRNLTTDLSLITSTINGYKPNEAKSGAQTLKGGTFLQDGIRKAQEMLAGGREDAAKIMVVLSDGEPTYSYKHSKTANDYTTLNTGDKRMLYTAFKKDTRGDGSPNNADDTLRLETISEAYLAKNANTKIYTIAYDSTRDNKVTFVMKNVASSLDTFYQASSGQSTDTSALIGSVITAVSHEVEKDIAAATGAQLVDTLPGYMTDISENETKVTVNGQTLTWDLSDLGYEGTKSMTFSTKVDFYDMAEAYAEKHAGYADAKAVLKAISEGEEIWFDLNDTVKFHYTDKDNNPHDPEIIGGQTTIPVPQDQVEAFKYTISYYEDGKEIANSKFTGYKFANETAEIADLAAYAGDSVKYDKTKTTYKVNGNEVSAKTFTVTGNTNIRVDYYKNVFTVTYKDELSTNQTIKTFTKKYGEKVTAAEIPAVPTHAGKKNGHWSANLNGVEITENKTVNALYDDEIYNILYEVYVDGAKVDNDGVADVTAKYNGSVDLPTVDPATVGAVDGVANGISKTYTEGAWTITEDTAANAVIANGKLTQIKGDVTLKKYFTHDETYAITFKVTNSGDDENAKGTTYNVVWAANADELASQIPDLTNYSESTDNTAKYTYTQPAWNQADLAEVTGPKTITANRVSTIRSFDITFKFTDAEGEVTTETESYKYDVTPTLPDSMSGIAATPDDNEWDYTFNAFETFVPVTEARTYEASETRVKKTYSYTFKLVVDNGAPIVLASDSNVEYGTPITAPSVDAYVEENNIKQEGYTYNYTRGWNEGAEFTLGSDGQNIDLTTYISSSINSYPVKVVLVSQDEFGKEIERVAIIEKSYEYGASVPYDCTQNDLWKTEDAEFSYEVTGTATDTIVVPAGATEITVIQKAVRKSYTVTFIIKDEVNNTEDSTDRTVPYGSAATAPQLPADTALEAAADQKDGVDEGCKKWDYTVSGWDNDYSKITGPLTVTATITRELIEYTVTFIFTDYEGKETKTEESGNYGDEIDIPQIVYSENNDEFTYKYDIDEDWSGETYIVKGNATLTATESRTTNEYTVNFVIRYTGDETRNATVDSVKVKYGQTAEAPEIGQEFLKESNAQWSYPESVAFTDVECPVYVNANKSYTQYVDYPATLNQYEVLFKHEDGTIINNEVLAVTDEDYKYDYGTELTISNLPTKEDSADGHYRYEFAYWTNEAGQAVSPAAIVVSSAVYVAAFTPIEKEYKVSFVDEDGTFFGENVPYVATVVWGSKVSDADLAAARAKVDAKAAEKTNASAIFTYAKGDWTFGGEEKPSAEAFLLNGPVKEDTTVYASYTRTNNTCTFVYMQEDAVNGGYKQWGDSDHVEVNDEGIIYITKTVGPAKDASVDTVYTFVGWFLGDAPIITEDETATRRIRIASNEGDAPGATDLGYYPEGTDSKIITQINVNENVRQDKTYYLYPCYKKTARLYKVTFVDYDGRLISEKADYRYNQSALGDKPANPSGWTTVSGFTTTTYTFKNWSVSDAELAAVTKDMVVAAEYSFSSTNNFPPIITPTPDPTGTPTPTPTATPTPTPVEEEIIPETPDTPQGPVEEPEEEIIPPQPETPQGAPEEEVDLDDIETPQGDLPKTGTTPTAVFFGIGAACIMLGSVMLKGIRRREEDM